MRFRLLLIVPLAVAFCRPEIGQVIRQESANTPEALNSLPFVDLSDKQKAHSSQNVSSGEMDRAQRYDKQHTPPLFNEQNPEKSGEIYYKGRYNYGGDRDPLPVKDADVIVVGKITSGVPHLTKSGNAVYTTFNLSPHSFIKGDLGGTSTSLTLEREGGVVLFPSGKKRFEGVTGKGLPVPNYSYLLFLKATPTKDSYSILRGYALGGSHVISLDAVDQRIEALSEATLLSEVKAKILAN